LEYKSWAGEIKTVAGGNGGFEGYASLFGVKDNGGDVVEPGAFAEAIPDFVVHGFIADGHNWSSVSSGAIGTIVDAKEDERGLFVRTEYHSTPAAQVARSIAQERMARGKSVGLSIGFGISADGFDVDSDGIRHLRKIKPLFEVSQVNVPMLRPAGLTAIKGFGIPFDDHSDNVRVAVAEWLERARSGSDVRLKEGRPISEARRVRMAAVRDSLHLGVSEIDALLKETEPRRDVQKDDDEAKAADPVLAGLFAQLSEFDAVYGHLRS
jgi:HK97 family phage prohead protease